MQVLFICLQISFYYCALCLAADNPNMTALRAAALFIIVSLAASQLAQVEEAIIDVLEPSFDDISSKSLLLTYLWRAQK